MTPALQASQAIQLVKDPNLHRQVGLEIAARRQALNLTLQEISARLHIRPRYLTAIENGSLEQLPGAVYARGYLQTYCEFLGLNSEALVAQCFTHGAPVVEAQKSVDVKPTLPGRSEFQGRYAIKLVVAGLLLVVMVSQCGRTAKFSENFSTMDVPESVVESLRTDLMPLAMNHECLSKQAWFGCQHDEARTKTFWALRAAPLGYAIEDLPALVAAQEDPASVPEETLKKPLRTRNTKRR